MSNPVTFLRRLTLVACLLVAGFGGFRLTEELKREANAVNDGSLLEALESVYANLSVHLEMRERMGPRLVLEELRRKIAEARTSGLNHPGTSVPWAMVMFLSLLCAAWMIVPEFRPEVPAKKIGNRGAHWRETFVHSCSDGILQIDPASDGVIIRYANPASERLLGYGAGELAGKPFSMVLPAAGSRRQAAARVRSREMARRKDGNSMIVEVSSHRIAHEDGSVVTAFLLRGAPAESSGSGVQRVDENFQWAPVPLFLFGRDGRILQMNRSAELLTGYAAAESRSNHYWELFQDAKAAEQGRQEFEAALLNREHEPSLQVWMTREGHRLPVRLIRTEMRDRAGLPSNLVAVALPAEQQGNVDFSQLADHLTAVAGYAELLLMTIGADDPVRPDLEQIQAAGAAAVNELAAAANGFDGFKERVEV